MKISPKDTVQSVMIEHSAIFSLCNDRLYEELKDRKKVDFVPMHISFRKDRMLKCRSVNAISMQELDTIQNNLSGYEYFEKTLAVMLKIDESQVRDLRFLYAYRYFIEILRELKEVGKKWNSLKLPLTNEERKAKVKRPNVGLFGLCQSYNESMGGGPNGVQDAWQRPWIEIFNYMQQKYYDALEQRRMIELGKKR